MAGLNERLRRLEASGGSGECPECGSVKGAPVEDEKFEVVWEDEEGADPQPEWCGTCDEQLVFIVGWGDLPDEDPGEGDR